MRVVAGLIILGGLLGSVAEVVPALSSPVGQAAAQASRPLVSEAQFAAWQRGIVTRAVLYDIARLKGVPYLGPGDRIHADDMEAWERRTGVRVGPGDALVLRWGRYGRRARLGPEVGFAGFDNSILPWLKQRDVALIVWETAAYAPRPEGDLRGAPVHDFVQAIMGIHVVDRADLEAVGEAAAVRNRWEFLLTVSPLALPKATGSPVNPVAMF